MKNFAFIVLSVVVSAAASPLGDPILLRRHNGVVLSRRYVLESRVDAPPQCAATAPTSTSTPPDHSTSAIPLGDPSANSTDPSLAVNSTVATPANVTAALNTTTDASNTTASRRSTRSWARHLGVGAEENSFSSSESVSSESSSFEESVSTFVDTWETLCLNSGGDIFTNDPCSIDSFGGIDALLETADPCDQQDIADNMITFAKGRGIKNKDSLVNFAMSYRKHSRHAVEILGTIPSSLFCLKASVNEELIGVYNAQSEGVNRGVFGSPSVPLVPFGSDGTCPYSMTIDMSSCGCVSSSDSTTPTVTSDDASDSDDSDDAADDDDSDATPVDSSDEDADDADSDAAPTDSTSTDTADDASATDAASTDSADASADTDATPTDAADADVTPTSLASGPNFQPTDISGDVNDPEGRR